MALAITSITASGTTSCTTGRASGPGPLAEKWIGASMCVPECSCTVHSIKLKPSFLNSFTCFMAMPGVPKKVGNSGENVCVRSVTLLNAGNGRASAAAGANVAAASAPPAPLKKPRRESLALTCSMQPGAHMSVPPSSQDYRLPPC